MFIRAPPDRVHFRCHLPPAMVAMIGTFGVAVTPLAMLPPVANGIADSGIMVSVRPCHPPFRLITVVVPEIAVIGLGGSSTTAAAINVVNDADTGTFVRAEFAPN